MNRNLLGIVTALMVGGVSTSLAASSPVEGSTAAPRQVLIEAVILELRTDASSTKACKANFAAKAVQETTQAAGVRKGGSSCISSIGEDLETILSSMTRDRRVRILQRPRIQTSHDVPATLFVGSILPDPRGHTSRETNSNSAQNSLQVGTTFHVTPLIKPDGQISLDLRFRMDRIVRNERIKGVGLVPVISTREMQTALQVRDRETIVLGGLVGDSEEPVVPILHSPKELPAPKILHSTSAHAGQSELIVLVRPTLLASSSADGRR